MTRQEAKAIARLVQETSTPMAKDILELLGTAAKDGQFGTIINLDELFQSWHMPDKDLKDHQVVVDLLRYDFGYVVKDADDPTVEEGCILVRW